MKQLLKTGMEVFKENKHFNNQFISKNAFFIFFFFTFLFFLELSDRMEHLAVPFTFIELGYYHLTRGPIYLQEHLDPRNFN